MRTKKEINEKIAYLEDGKLIIDMFLDSRPLGDACKNRLNEILRTASLKKKEDLTRTEIMFVKHELQGMLAALRWVKK